MLSLALLLLCPTSWGALNAAGKAKNIRNKGQPELQRAPEGTVWNLNMGTEKGSHDVMHNDIIADAFLFGSEDFGSQEIYNVPASHHHFSLHIYSTSKNLVYVTSHFE